MAGYQQQQRHHQNWQTVSESGILRRREENEEELLVFGYSCKLFRDDEKALFIDQGKHLIPWMGNDLLKIDRYDVRGALYDLSQYEAVAGHQDETFWMTLSNEERKIEQMCNEERYRALVHNEDEEALYQEEELKRLHQALGGDKGYGQVSYKYENDEKNGEGGEGKLGDENAQNDDTDEPFIPLPELDIPQNMVLPETVKHNAIIEKTAMFIHRQGSQMEILLKMKQAGNPQFEFLSFDCPLHTYYRHILMAIKTGRYRPKIPNAAGEHKLNEEKQTQDQNYYLHRTLAPSSSVNVAPSIPSISYKPSEDCAYSMLVNKIKGNQNKFTLLHPTSVAGTVIDKSDILGDSNSNNSNDLPLLRPPTTSDTQPHPDPTRSLKRNEGINVNTAFGDKEEENSPKSREEKAGDSNDAVGLPANENSSESVALKRESPLLHVTRPPKRRKRKRPQGGCAYIDEDTVEDDSTAITTMVMMSVVPEVPEEEFIPVEEEAPYFAVPETLRSEAEAEEPVKVDILPADLQLIIDKMASYVAKNGRNFEEIVRSKGDPRFYFLDPNNQYYMFYCKQVEHYENSARLPEVLDDVVAGSDTVNSKEKVVNEEVKNRCVEVTNDVRSHENSNNNNNSEDCYKVNNSEGGNKKPAIIKPMPVCFSIKKPKESEGLEIKSALPVEESSEEDEEEEGRKNTDKGKGGEDESNNDRLLEADIKVQTTSTKSADKLSNVSSSSSSNKKVANENISSSKKFTSDNSSSNKKVITENSSSNKKVITENISSSKRDTSENSSTNKKAATVVHPEKWAEERVKDKLAAAAREKLIIKEREKQLQLERKRRAAAFLNLLQKEGLTKEKPALVGPRLPQDDENSDSSVSEGSISSPPSSVTSPEAASEKQAAAVMTSPTKKPKPMSDLMSFGLKAKPTSTYLPGSLEEELRNREESEIRRKHKKSKWSKSDRKRSSVDSSRHHRKEGKEERSHHRKHRHRRRRQRGTSGHVDGGREHLHHTAVSEREAIAVDASSSSSSRHHRHHRHRHKYYKAKKHKRKSALKKAAKSESSASSETSDSD